MSTEIDARRSDGMIVNRDNEGLQSVEPLMHDPHDKSATLYNSEEQHQGNRRRILGLSVTMFWIVMLVIVLNIAGGLGGWHWRRIGRAEEKQLCIEVRT
jgi:hypothetical protein